MKRRTAQAGYVALLSVLVVGVAATAIAVTLLLTGTDSQRSALVAQQSKQARGLAVACGEEALQQIHDTMSYIGSSGSLSLGQGTCTYTVTANNSTTRTIGATGTVGGVVKKVNATVTIGATTETVSSWKEVTVLSTGSSGPSTPAFVQIAAATPQTSQTSTTATYATEVVGNTNIVIVGWNSITTSITSLVDNAGNTYQIAAPMTRGSSHSQAIYYAKNITGGAPTVTVTMSASTAFIDMRIMEYSGLDTSTPFDVAASGIGGSGTATSGNLTTNFPVELIVGGGSTLNSFTAAGSNYTLRLLTQDSDIAEDRVVNATGTYAATANVTGPYVMQAAAFKAAGQ